MKIAVVLTFLVGSAVSGPVISVPDSRLLEVAELLKTTYLSPQGTKPSSTTETPDARVQEVAKILKSTYLSPQGAKPKSTTEAAGIPDSRVLEVAKLLKSTSPKFAKPTTDDAAENPDSRLQEVAKLLKSTHLTQQRVKPSVTDDAAENPWILVDVYDILTPSQPQEANQTDHTGVIQTGTSDSSQDTLDVAKQMRTAFQAVHPSANADDVLAEILEPIFQDAFESFKSQSGLEGGNQGDNFEVTMAGVMFPIGMISSSFPMPQGVTQNGHSIGNIGDQLTMDSFTAGPIANWLQSVAMIQTFEHISPDEMLKLMGTPNSSNDETSEDRNKANLQIRSFLSKLNTSTKFGKDLMEAITRILALNPSNNDLQYFADFLTKYAFSNDGADLKRNIYKATKPINVDTLNSASEVTPSSNIASEVTPSSNSASYFTPSSNIASEVTPASNSASDVTPSSNSASEVTPSSNSVSEVTPSSISASDVTPSSNIASEVTPSSNSASEDTPSSNSASYVTPSSNSASEVTPSSNIASDVTSSLNSASEVTPSSNSASEVTPSSNSASEVTPSSYSVSEVTPSSNSASQVTPSLNSYKAKKSKKLV